MPYHGEGRRGNCDRRSCGARSDCCDKVRQARRSCAGRPGEVALARGVRRACRYHRRRRQLQCRVPVRLPEGQATDECAAFGNRTAALSTCDPGARNLSAISSCSASFFRTPNKQVGRTPLGLQTKAFTRRARYAGVEGVIKSSRARAAFSGKPCAEFDREDRCRRSQRP